MGWVGYSIIRWQKLQAFWSTSRVCPAFKPIYRKSKRALTNHCPLSKHQKTGSISNNTTAMNMSTPDLYKVRNEGEPQETVDFQSNDKTIRSIYIGVRVRSALCIDWEGSAWSVRSTQVGNNNINSYEYVAYCREILLERRPRNRRHLLAVERICRLDDLIAASDKQAYIDDIINRYKGFHYL